jgi:hypothetical protein
MPKIYVRASKLKVLKRNTMHDADHYKRWLAEQIEVLVAHQSMWSEPDYAFVRSHAQAIVEICEQAIAVTEANGPRLVEEIDSKTGDDFLM